jgi:hypothetical protein
MHARLVLPVLRVYLSLLCHFPWSSCQLLGRFLTRNYSSVFNGVGSNFDENGARRPVRKERDDKVHDSIIEQRIQRERPCRTLFIRNIKASASSQSIVLCDSTLMLIF